MGWLSPLATSVLSLYAVFVAFVAWCTWGNGVAVLRGFARRIRHHIPYNEGDHSHAGRSQGRHI
jgi:hypothetical protein